MILYNSHIKLRKLSFWKNNLISEQINGRKYELYSIIQINSSKSKFADNFKYYIYERIPLKIIQKA
jgi:hypothetical protein